AADGLGVTPPAFLLAKAIPQMESSLADARSGGSMVQSLVRRAMEANIPGDWEARARPVVTRRIAAALERQLAELQRQGGRAPHKPRMCVHAPGHTGDD